MNTSWVPAVLVLGRPQWAGQASQAQEFTPLLQSPCNSRSELWWTKSTVPGELSIIEIFLEEVPSEPRLVEWEGLSLAGRGQEGSGLGGGEHQRWERLGPGLREVVA